MTILNLKEETEHIALLAQWHHSEWGYLNPNASVEQRAEKMRLYLNDEIIPGTFIYKHNNQLAGSVAILANDMDTHKELSPWLASLYVAKEFRQKGIGSKLVKYLIQMARSHGMKRLYLFTPNQEKFYSTLGWKKVNNEIYHGHPVVIMSFDLLNN